MMKYMKLDMMKQDALLGRGWLPSEHTGGGSSKVSF